MERNSQAEKGNTLDKPHHLSDRAHLAAAMRPKHSLEERIQSAIKASHCHYLRTKRCLNVTTETVASGNQLPELDQEEDFQNPDLRLPVDLTVEKLWEERETRLAALRLKPAELSRYVQRHASRYPEDSMEDMGWERPGRRARHAGSDAKEHSCEQSTEPEDMKDGSMGSYDADHDSEDSNAEETSSKSLRQQASIYQSKRMNHKQWSKFQAEKRMEFDQWLKLYNEKEEASKNTQGSDVNGTTDGS
jgi:hypothetical protein